MRSSVPNHLPWQATAHILSFEHDFEKRGHSHDLDWVIHHPGHYSAQWGAGHVCEHLLSTRPPMKKPTGPTYESDATECVLHWLHCHCRFVGLVIRHQRSDHWSQSARLWVHRKGLGGQNQYVLPVSRRDNLGLCCLLVPIGPVETLIADM